MLCFISIMVFGNGIAVEFGKTLFTAEMNISDGGIHIAVQRQTDRRRKSSNRNLLTVNLGSWNL